MALITLAEAKTALNIPAADVSFDTELQDYIDGASVAVDFICGASTDTPVTEVVHACGAIALRCTPILSLTSVTGDIFGVRDLTVLRFDAYTGVIRPKATALPLREDYYTVVYHQGRATAPAALKTATKSILKHQWGTQRRGPVRPSSTDVTMVPGLGYAVPNAALEMLSPYDRGPSVV